MPITFQEQHLDNGLTVIGEIDPDAHTAAIGYFVKTGSRDEQAPLMGVSHFLEHMMFKGTARRSADDVNREFDELGANYNAYTSQENTVYWAQVLPEFFPQATDLLSDMLRPALRSKDFDMEKKVILEEIGMYADRPQWRLQDTIIETHYANHTLGFRVLGTNDTVGALTVEQMRDYFKKRYSPDNITVAVAGQVDFKRVVADLEKLTQAWEPAGAKRDYVAWADSDCQLSLIDEKLNRHYVGLVCSGPSSQDESRYAAGIVADVLGDADGSRLYWALVDPGLADEADISHIAQDQVGSFFAYASCDPDRAEQVEQMLLETLDKYANSIEEKEIQRAKNKIATQATVHGESPCGRMRALGSQWTYLGKYVPLEEEVKRMMSVTVDDVKALVAQHSFRPRTLVRLGPKKV